MSEEIKGCPFCGHPDSLVVYHDPNTLLHPWFRVECDYCGAGGTGSDKGDQLIQWSLRAVTVAEPGASASQPELLATTGEGMEPVAWVARHSNGRLAGIQLIRPENPSYRGNYHLDGVETVNLYSAEQLADMAIERDEALCLLKDHVALQLHYQAKLEQAEKDKAKLLGAMKLASHYCLSDVGAQNVLDEAIAKSEVKS